MVDWSCSRLPETIAAAGEATFWPLLNALLDHEVAFSSMGVFLYVRDLPPVRLYDSEGCRRDSIHAILIDEGYLLSPYYSNIIRPRATADFYSISGIVNQWFTSSQYYNLYYKKKDVYDEGMFHLPIAKDKTVVLMVERRHGMAHFSHIDEEALRSLFPLVESLVGTHFKQRPGHDGVEAERQRPGRFQHMVERFGTQVLSAREQDVALLILRGHSSKSAARQLGIAPETERVHRRRLYGKLGINAHSELFRVFFEANEFFDPASEVDPLAAYLGTRASDKSGAIKATGLEPRVR
jgi:DNA-binding CsgD family transcriptional regulator